METMSELVAGWFKQQFRVLRPGQDHKAHRLSGVPRHVKRKPFTLVEAASDTDARASGIQWFGFVMQDERGLVLTRAEAEQFNLHIFRVAGVDSRADVLQHSAFDPGRVLKVFAEANNANDCQVGVWDGSGVVMAGYVPKSHNELVRAAIELPGHAAVALGEHRKDDKRVSLTVMFGPMEPKAYT